MTETVQETEDAVTATEEEASLIPNLDLSPEAVISTFAKSSVKFVITSAITTLVPTETRVQKAKLAVGSYMIASFVTETASTHIRETVDRKVGYIRGVKAAYDRLQVTINETSDTESTISSEA